MNYLKHPATQSSKHDEAMDMAKPMTTKSMMQRAAYGSLLVSLQASKGLCPERKCVRKENHPGTHWPTA